MMCTRGVTKTILLKSPDSNKVREIIVTSVLLPKSENCNNRTLSKITKSSEASEVVTGKRAGKRLDHLTLEEKILRKKLKNREAAQTSRDRKKARLEELEASVVHLQSENESLHEEVRSLKDERDTLLRENARLTEEVWRLSVGCDGPRGPAVSHPLPKGRPPRRSAPPAPPVQSQPLLHPLLVTFLQTLMSWMTIGTGLTICPSPLLLLRNWNSLQISCLLKPLEQKIQTDWKKIWLGRRQKAWNPVGRVSPAVIAI